MLSYVLKVYFCVQVGAALPKRQHIFLWGSVLLFPSAAPLPYLTYWDFWFNSYRNLHGAMRPCCHVSHVHGRHPGGLSHVGKSFARQVSFRIWRTKMLPKDKGCCKMLSFFVRFSEARPALSVVIYPLQHEDLPSVIRGIPLTLLDRLTLFQSHVAQPPHLSPLWHRHKP